MSRMRERDEKRIREENEGLGRVRSDPSLLELRPVSRGFHSSRFIFFVVVGGGETAVRV